MFISLDLLLNLLLNLDVIEASLWLFGYFGLSFDVDLDCTNGSKFQQNLDDA